MGPGVKRRRGVRRARRGRPQAGAKGHEPEVSCEFCAFSRLCCFARAATALICVHPGASAVNHANYETFHKNRKKTRGRTGTRPGDPENRTASTKFANSDHKNAKIANPNREIQSRRVCGQPSIRPTAHFFAPRGAGVPPACRKRRRQTKPPHPRSLDPLIPRSLAPCSPFPGPRSQFALPRTPESED
jgi:hypothetical protein